MAMRDDLQAKIDELVAAIGACVAREGYTDVALRPHAPASQQEIDDYEAYLGVKLPHSYREFLLLYNGYDWLAYPGHMLSIASVMPGGDWYDEIVEWKKISAEYGSAEVIDGIVIANLGDVNNWAYVVPDRPSGDDELTIVIDLNATVTELADLLELFDWCIKVTTI
jgi:hypothetical protein